MFRDLRLRLRALLAPRRVERELDEELAFHIEREAQQHIDRGVSSADARARARLRPCGKSKGDRYLFRGVRGKGACPLYSSPSPPLYTPCR
jgi:hypothetical protein